MEQLFQHGKKTIDQKWKSNVTNLHRGFDNLRLQFETESRDKYKQIQHLQQRIEQL